MPQSEFSKVMIAYSDRIRKVLKPSRYAHTIGVAYTAASLAMCHGADMKKALIAGLLHDYAKGFDEKEQIRRCDCFGVVLTPAEREIPALIHAKLSAYYAEHEFEVTDTQILDAIRYHTTGRPDMTLLEKIVFVADYIEPGRIELPVLEEVRPLAYDNLDRCVTRISDAVLTYLSEEGKKIDPMTKRTADHYRKA